MNCIDLASAKIVPLLAATSLLWLAGCGGSGSSSPSPTLPPAQTNNAPVFGQASTLTLAENIAQVGTFTASDADSDNLSYSLSAGADIALFSMNSSTALLTFNSAPDFESPQDADANNIYLVQVTANDGQASSNLSLAITITDIDESQLGLADRPANPSCIVADAPTLSSAIELNRVFPNLNFNRPVALVQSPVVADRWYVVEQPGLIKTFASNDPAATNFADLVSRVDNSGNEMGLLGLVFHPDFANNNYLYVYYSASGGALNHQSVIARFTAINATSVDINSEVEIMRFDQPFSNHNGGNILFGDDGFLYIGLGDGGAAGDPQNLSQNTSSLLGKMLRIDVDSTANGNNYAIPSDNPFVGQAGLDEIFALGLRNPWRWSFDRLTGDLYAADVGQDEIEEIDIVTLGGNYGWRCYEGNSAFNTSGCQPQSAYDAPIFEYDQSVGFSITGGYVYRGSAIPALNGTYLYTDFGSGPIWGLSDPSGANPTNSELISAPFFISSFAQDNNGELYVLNFSNGQIFRIDPASGTGVGNFPEQLSETGCIDNNDPLSMSSGLIPYDINAPFWSDGAIKTRWMALQDNSQITIENNGDWAFPANSVLVKNFELNGRRIETRLLVKHANGNWGGYSYEWNDQQTDATLVLSGKTVTKEGQSYIFPSSNDCFLCHTDVAGVSLGTEIRQLNRSFTYPSTGINANQLTTLEAIGMFDAALSDIADNLEQLVSPADTNASFHDRARSYLHTNCSQCHRQNATINVNLDFDILTADTDMNICDQAPTHQIGGATAIMDAGNSANSSMILRMNCREGLDGCQNDDQMPPLGSTLVDTSGVDIVASWIDSLQQCP